MPALLGLDAGPALITAPVEILGGIAGAAQADLEHLVVLQQAFFPRAAEGTAVRHGFAEHLFVGIRMRVDVDQRHRPVLFRDGPQDGPGQGMVATQRQGNGPVGQDTAIMLGNDTDGFLEVEKVDRHIPDVGHLQMLERGRARRHVVRADHAAFVADLARPEAGARPVRSADIHRDTDKTGIQPFGSVLRRQAHHGAGAARAGHGIAAERLVIAMF